MQAALTDMPDVRLAVLFGSRAIGKGSASSDVDIGVAGDGSKLDLAALAVRLERHVRCRVDLVVLDDAPPLLRFEIARDGRPLVEREPHAWADFKARAMIDWWDWQPTHAIVRRVLAERLRQEASEGPR